MLGVCTNLNQFRGRRMTCLASWCERAGFETEFNYVELWICGFLAGLFGLMNDRKKENMYVSDN